MNKVRTIENWCLSAQKKPIALHHSPHFSWEQLERPVVLIGGVHGDEPEGVALAESCLQWLDENIQNVTLPWVLISCINPDGYSVNQRVNGNGVDLNRNFASKNWSPEVKQTRYHPGASPGSEPETQALMKLIKEKQPRLLIHCHSWKPCIVCTGEPGLQDANYLAQASGFEVVNEIGYPTPGSLSSFGWHDNQIPVICIEDEEHRNSEIPWPRFGPGLEKVFLDNSDRR